MDSAILWRVALVQAVAVAALSLLLGLLLSEGFFEDWGLAGWADGLAPSAPGSRPGSSACQQPR